MPHRRRNRRNKWRSKKLLYFLQSLLYVLRIILAVLGDLVALVAVWSVSFSTGLMVDIGRTTYHTLYRAIQYSCGRVWRILFRTGSVGDNQRIAFIIKLERFGETTCLMVLVPAILWAGIVLYLRDAIRCNDQTLPDILSNHKPRHNYLELRGPSGTAQRPVLVIRNSFNRRRSSTTPADNIRTDLPFEYVLDALCFYASRDPSILCNLCWEEIRTHDEIMLLPCRQTHCFHARCGILSVMQRGKCPVCKEWIVDQI